MDFPARGHALLDGSFDLVAVLAASKIFAGFSFKSGFLNEMQSIILIFIIRNAAQGLIT